MKPFTFCIGGEAGYGITSTGLIFSKIAARSNFFVFNYLEYPSIIRGGHNAVFVTFSDEKVSSPYKTIDFLVALNQETIDLHKDHLKPGACLVYDSEQKMLPPKRSDLILFDIPMTRIAKEKTGAVLQRDTAALGAVLALLDGNLQILNDVLEDKFGKKGAGVIKENFDVAAAGFEFTKTHFKDQIKPIIKTKKEVRKYMIMTGNDAAALGAVAGGMQFASIYPMTPISNILHVLAPLQEEYGFIYKQPEDEISAINMAIGASYGGARAMTASSGGGFCLMTEGYGLAGITETPIVIIEGMRGAPATGLPTWTEQGDLRFVLHAHQGEFPRIVLAPGDIEETFHLVMKAFNLAEKYQTPVIVLVDKTICEGHQSLPPFDYGKYKVERGKFVAKKVSNYKRYALAADGISPRSPAGVGNHVFCNSDEHDEEGYTSETAENREAQMNKRMQKLETCRLQDMEPPKLYGPKDADLTVVTWGSTKGAILEAMKELPNVNMLHLTWMNPFPTDEVKKILLKAKKLLNIEGNFTAQLGGMLTEHTGIRITDNLVKYDGRPFFPEEIIEEIKKRI